MELKVGQQLGRYRIEGKIGAGGMGSVYRATDTLLDREVAVKSLRVELAGNEQLLTRFRTEAQTLAKLNHSNIATLYTLLRENDTFWMGG